jgi:hypothetical protein
MVSNRSIAMRTITPEVSPSRISAAPRSVFRGWKDRSIRTIRSKSLGTAPSSRGLGSCRTWVKSWHLYQLAVWVGDLRLKEVKTYQVAQVSARRNVTRLAIESWFWGIPGGRCCLLKAGGSSST